MANIQEEWEKKWVDYYKLFGIQMNAIEEEIKKAYRKLIRKYHPDNSGDNELCYQVQEGYRILSNQQKREKYDKTYLLKIKTNINNQSSTQQNSKANQSSTQQNSKANQSSTQQNSKAYRSSTQQNSKANQSKEDIENYKKGIIVSYEKQLKQIQEIENFLNEVLEKVYLHKIKPEEYPNLKQQIISSIQTIIENLVLLSDEAFKYGLIDTRQQIEEDTLELKEFIPTIPKTFQEAYRLRKKENDLEKLEKEINKEIQCIRNLFEKINELMDSAKNNFISKQVYNDELKKYLNEVGIHISNLQQYREKSNSMGEIDVYNNLGNVMQGFMAEMEKDYNYKKIKPKDDISGTIKNTADNLAQKTNDCMQWISNYIFHRNEHQTRTTVNNFLTAEAVISFYSVLSKAKYIENNHLGRIKPYFSDRKKNYMQICAKLEGKKMILHMLEKEANINNMLYVQTLLDKITLVTEIKKTKALLKHSNQGNIKLILLEIELESHYQKLDMIKKQIEIYPNFCIGSTQLYQLEKEEQNQICYILEQINKFSISKRYELKMSEEEQMMYNLTIRMYSRLENSNLNSLEDKLEYKKAEKERNLEFIKNILTRFKEYRVSWSWTSIYNCNIDYDIGYLIYCIQHKNECMSPSEIQIMYLQAELAGYEMRRKSLLDLITLYQQLYSYQNNTMLCIVRNLAEFQKKCKLLLEEQEYLIECKKSQLEQEKCILL